MTARVVVLFFAAVISTYFFATSNVAPHEKMTGQEVVSSTSSPAVLNIWEAASKVPALEIFSDFREAGELSSIEITIRCLQIVGKNNYGVLHATPRPCSHADYEGKMIAFSDELINSNVAHVLRFVLHENAWSLDFSGMHVVVQRYIL